MNRAKTFWVFGVLLALLVSVGCESSDSGSGGGIAGGHDFGVNNASVYVAFGDSITYGQDASVPYPALLASMLGNRVINKGVSGSQSSEGYARVNGVLGQYKPGYLLILYGANDVIHSIPPAQIIESLRGIVQAAKANSTIPVLATCTPQVLEHQAYNGGVVSLNVRIRSLASEEAVTLVDLETVMTGHEEYFNRDGLHPNNAGHSAIATAFSAVLQ
jgi:lysophospholipase L1-like esterase